MRVATRNQDGCSTRGCSRCCLHFVCACWRARRCWCSARQAAGHHERRQRAGLGPDAHAGDRARLCSGAVQKHGAAAAPAAPRSRSSSSALSQERRFSKRACRFVCGRMRASTNDVGSGHTLQPVAVAAAATAAAAAARQERSAPFEPVHHAAAVRRHADPEALLATPCSVPPPAAGAAVAAHPRIMRCGLTPEGHPLVLVACTGAFGGALQSFVLHSRCAGRLLRMLTLVRTGWLAGWLLLLLLMAAAAVDSARFLRSDDVAHLKEKHGFAGKLVLSSRHWARALQQGPR